MKIQHLAIWVKDLDKMKSFYEDYFGGKAGERYHNPKKHFHSYFISFAEGTKLELMHKPEIPENQNDVSSQNIGLIHFAIDPGSQAAVNELTERLRNDGFKIMGEPRKTGDGYWESVILDPEDNLVELCHDLSPRKD